jgi:hypothetical protein
VPANASEVLRINVATEEVSKHGDIGRGGEHTDKKWAGGTIVHWGGTDSVIVCAPEQAEKVLVLLLPMPPMALPVLMPTAPPATSGKI